MSAEARRRRVLRVLAPALFAAGALLARAARQDPGEPPAATEPNLVAEPVAALTFEPAELAARESAEGDRRLVAGDLDGAEAAYRRAIAAAPSAADPHVRLGRLLAERERRFAARRELLTAIELDPSNAVASFELGVLYDDAGLDRLARRHYRKAFELEPGLADSKLHPEVATRRQALAALLGLWSEGGEAFERASAEAATRTAPPAAVRAAPDRAERAPATAPAGAERSSGGGFVRVTGGERSADEVGPGSSELPEPSGGGGARPSRSRSGRPADSVIDASDLRGGTFVNQVVAPGESPGSGGRGGMGTSKGNRGFGSRFNPPQRAPLPTFEPDEESTGRIEPFLAPSDPSRFAIGG